MLKCAHKSDSLLRLAQSLFHSQGGLVGKQPKTSRESAMLHVHPKNRPFTTYGWSSDDKDPHIIASLCVFRCLCWAWSRILCCYRFVWMREQVNILMVLCCASAIEDAHSAFRRGEHGRSLRATQADPTGE